MTIHEQSESTIEYPNWNRDDNGYTREDRTNSLGGGYTEYRVHQLSNGWQWEHVSVTWDDQGQVTECVIAQGGPFEHAVSAILIANSYRAIERHYYVESAEIEKNKERIPATMSDPPPPDKLTRLVSPDCDLATFRDEAVHLTAAELDDLIERVESEIKQVKAKKDRNDQPNPR